MPCSLAVCFDLDTGQMDILCNLSGRFDLDMSLFHILCSLTAGFDLGAVQWDKPCSSPLRFDLDTVQWDNPCNRSGHFDFDMSLFHILCRWSFGCFHCESNQPHNFCNLPLRFDLDTYRWDNPCNPFFPCHFDTPPSRNFCNLI
jgi:hypothetical protein